MSVSLCMIAKDSEAGLAKCLHSVHGLFDEIIVVDTGSVDGTPEIARRRGARVIPFAWVDDFAAARNESLRHATSKWVMWLDTDEWLTAVEAGFLGTLLKKLPSDPRVYLARQVSATAIYDGQPRSFSETVWHPRLWRRHPDVQWVGRVHEQIMPAFDQRGYQLVKTALKINHGGYASMFDCHRKLIRNKALSEIEVREQPDKAEAWFFYGRTLLGLQMPRAAADALEQAIALARPADGWVRLARQMLQTIEKEAQHVEA